PPGPEGPPG
nr:Chain C, PRO-PRO-GLY-PRO-GLU-GLY-PRO-PRO-GLY [synthetic construct]